MRILEVLPTYPGDALDGSAVYERSLNRALLARGTHVEVLTTRAQKLRHEREFSIRWPDDLPRRGEHDGVRIARFHALDSGPFGGLMSESVTRRWSKEDFVEGAVISQPSRYTEAAVQQARRRPPFFDLLADIGRGPLVPGLLAHLLRQAPKFDVILAGYAPFSLPKQALWAGRRCSVPVVLLPFIHESDRYHQFASLLRTYEQAAAVFTLSESTSEFLRRYVPRAKPVTIGAGVTTIDSGRMSAEQFRARHGLADRRIVLYVGRKELSKRYDLAVAAIENAPEEALLVMVGRDVDGKPITSDRVRHLGPLSDEELAAAYEACDAFVLPSEFESFGMVFLDAWVHAKPVIGNLGCAATASLIDDGIDGFLCRDADEIAGAVARLVDDPALARRMGEAGRQKTLSRYTWERVADRVSKALDDVLATSSSR